MDSATIELDLWVARFRDHRPVGRPLYGWRCDEAQYRELGALLRAALEGSARWSEARWCVEAVSRAFVLYGAEWWHREYRGGAWGWDPLFESLAAAKPGHMVYQRLVREGLKCWGRAVRRPGQTWQYLGTVVHEGGLPLRVLGEGGSVSRYLHAVMRDFARFSGSTSALELAREHSDALPQVLQRNNVEFLEMVAALVEQIAKWQAELGESEDVVRALAQGDPEWQNKLPLRVDTDAARRLLRGLFREASARRPSDASAVPAMTVVLEEQRDERWQVRRRLELPRSMSVAAVSTWLGTDSSGARTLSVIAEAYGQDAVLVARAERRTRGADEVYVFSERDGARTVEAWPHTTAIWLKVHAEGGPVELPLLGGDPLHEGAWVFGPLGAESAAWRLLWQGGGGRTPCSEALVVAPAGVELEGVGVVCLGVLEPEHLRQVRRCDGDVTWGAERLQTRQAKASGTAQLELRGPLLSSAAALEPVFAGCPQVRLVETSGAVRVRPTTLTWRSAWGRRAEPVSSAWADGWLGVEDRAGGVWCKVAPGSASLALHPLDGQGPNAGEIEVGGFGALRVGLEPAAGVDNVSVTQDVGADLWRVRVQSDSPPRALTLVIQDRRTRALRVRVRYPSALGCFATSQRRIRPGERVHLDRVVTLRAELLDPRRIGGQHVVVARLDGGMQAHMALTEESPGSQAWGSHLDGLRGQIGAMLAQSWRLDAEVELKLNTSPHSACLIVARFEGFVRAMGDPQEGPSTVQQGEVLMLGVSLDQDTWAPPEGDAAVQLEAISLCDMTHRVDLQRAEEGWVLNTEGLNAGPWLVFGREGRMVRFRPKLVHVHDEADEDGAEGWSALERAIRERDGKRRSAMLTKWAEALADDPEHPDWEVALTVLRTTLDIPPVCFDVCKVFARTPRALTLALVKLCATDGPEGALRLRRGMLQMPFHDAMLSLDSWRSAVRALEAAHRKVQAASADAMTGGVEGAALRRWMVTDPLMRLSSAWETEAPCLKMLVDLARHEVLGDVAPREARLAQQCPDVMAGVIQRQHQEMSRLYSNMAWPTWEGMEQRHQAVLERLSSRLPSDVLRSLLQEPCVSAARHKKPALLAPLLAAALALEGAPVEPEDVVALRAMEAFAPDAFQAICAPALTLFWAWTP